VDVAPGMEKVKNLYLHIENRGITFFVNYVIASYHSCHLLYSFQELLRLTYTFEHMYFSKRRLTLNISTAHLVMATRRNM
jgi:hypothetical protein